MNKIPVKIGALSPRTAVSPTMAAQEDPDLLRILIATDNHLGVHEKDQVRKDDAFITFREIFEIAKQAERGRRVPRR